MLATGREKNQREHNTHYLCIFVTHISESHLEPKLKLTRIKSLSRQSKTRPRAKRIDRHCEIRAIQNIETLREKLQVNSFCKLESSTDTQIERGVVKTTSSISTDADWTIVVVTIEVTILSQQHVERQTRSVGEDVTELEATKRPLKSSGLSFLWRLDRATHNQAMPLVVVRQTTIVADVEVVLNGREEEVAGVVDRF